MINILNENTIKKIAAGEVIQKISNAVKELIENSIDAKSTKITIIFKEYGLNLIKIIDNGTGILKEDLPLTIKLHATSKTSNEDQFFGINSLGFRGEALASIDSVGELLIESNNHSFNKGNMGFSNISKGTAITITNIFSKLPARLKFIKNPKNEFKYIKECIKKYIILHEQIHWIIIHNNKQIMEYLPNTKLERLTELFKETPILYSEPNKNFKINAYIFKKNINFNAIFTNKRPIKDRVIVKYIQNLFKEYTFINENPSYLLFIEIDNIFVDFNVHPTKEEIKFFNYNDILKSIYNIFNIKNLVKDLNNNINSSYNPTSFDSNNLNLLKEDSIPIFKQTNIEVIKIKQNYQLNTLSANLMEQPSHIHIFGQFQNSFILFEKNTQFGIFDQHAAHERQIYENMKNNMVNTQPQILLNPIQLNLTLDQEIYIKNQNNILKTFKFNITNNIITTIPVFLKEINFKQFFEALPVNIDFETAFYRLLANIACKQAIKANHILNLQEMHVLLQQALINPPVCNHGRPVFKYFSRKNIEDFFKRT